MGKALELLYICQSVKLYSVKCQIELTYLKVKSNILDLMGCHISVYSEGSVNPNLSNSSKLANNFSSLLLDVYVWLNMFWALSRPSSGAQQQQ